MKEQKHMIHDGYTRINPVRPNIQPANTGPRAPISILKIDFVVQDQLLYSRGLGPDEGNCRHLVAGYGTSSSK